MTIIEKQTTAMLDQVKKYLELNAKGVSFTVLPGDQDRHPTEPKKPNKTFGQQIVRVKVIGKTEEELEESLIAVQTAMINYFSPTSGVRVKSAVLTDTGELAELSRTDDYALMFDQYEYGKTEPEPQPTAN